MPVISLEQKRNLTKAFWRWIIVRKEDICKLWVVFEKLSKKNPPVDSRFGGIWVHEIRSASAVLISILRTHGCTLNDEALNTLPLNTKRSKSNSKVKTVNC